eukprot:TRINITY_DN2228_c0_g1_i1.p1 TRINITY_DN2228_c0_g1~~TRINITY_DN2228_c0_g1_i1.p1  ORF type:complete len:476 (+),score=108.08 TRINITY_DN2228_c0_g1_i1:38-1465(+)
MWSNGRLQKLLNHNNSVLLSKQQIRHASRNKRKWAERGEKLLQIAGVIIGGVALWKITTVVKGFAKPEQEYEDKPKVVVLGTGFASLGLIDSINTKKFDVSVVSPNDYFVYTPLLSSAAMGAVDLESIVEPIHSFTQRTDSTITFYEAKCEDVDLENNKVICKSPSSKNQFELDYDYLVVGVGSFLNDDNTAGVKKNCLFLSNLSDAVHLRNKVISSLEYANLPSTTDEERAKLLHFVVVGGSPYAYQTASQIQDYLDEKVKAHFPKLQEFAKVSLVHYNDHIHNYYDKAISKFFKKKHFRENVQIIKGSVTSVGESELTLKKMGENLQIEVENVPYGTCVWATGKTAHPLAKKIANKLKETQGNELALVVDSSLKVLGSGNVFAIGDCATIDQDSLLRKVEKLFEKTDKNQDGVIDIEEFKQLCQTLGKKYPALLQVSNKAEEIFKLVDSDGNNKLDREEFGKCLKIFNNQLTR